jgi:hypothetical protein
MTEYVTVSRNEPSPHPMNATQQNDEIVDRYSQWRRLERLAERDWGHDDDVTALYRAKREAAETLADQFGVAVRHLNP